MSQPRFAVSTSGRVARGELPWWSVHVARYLFAQPYVAGHATLDVACGTGYGLPILRARSRLVVGVEADLGAARKALTYIGEGPEAVILADGCRLPFADRSFEVVTSFET